jgi:nicotinic acid mononucleotide adenylyltransferase/nicotinamide mononucleotide (NMN) deamidase PncC
MNDDARRSLIERIHASGRQMVLAVTGGGSGAISALLQVPGASASVLEAIVPYSSRSLDEWLGGKVDQYCSERTARAMAMRAFERARELSQDDPEKLIGVGATASLASTRSKRGSHRFFVAWQSATTTTAIMCHFPNRDGTRCDEEDIVTEALLRAIAGACKVDSTETPPFRLPLGMDERAQEAPRSWTDLLLGNRSFLEIPESRSTAERRVLFPGAFNPPHWGHERMTEIASARLGAPVTFELSIENVDKPSLDFIEIADRLSRLAGRNVLLTRAPTFVEKARLSPGCTFVIGADTIARIGNPAYYHDDAALRDAAIADISRLGCRFLVFGRSVGDRFESLSSTEIPPALRALCDEVPRSEFSADVSSTALRNEIGP